MKTHQLILQFRFEKVKGITNLDGGNFFDLIKKDLEGCVDKIKVNKVNSVDFAIPQIREIVIIIGGNRKLVEEFSLTPITALYKNGQTGMLPQIIGVKDALEDLPRLSHAENGSCYDYNTCAKTAFQKFVRGEISPDEYLNSYK